jgi:hypothetical protein
MARLPNTCRLTDDALSFGSTRSGGHAEIARTNCKVRIVTRPREKSAGRCPFASCAIGQTRMTKIVGISNGAAWRGPRQELGKAGQAAHPSTQSCCSLNRRFGWAPGFEPGNGGVKISLIVQRFQRAFGKNRPKRRSGNFNAWQPIPNERQRSQKRSIPQKSRAAACAHIFESCRVRQSRHRRVSNG